MKAIHLGARMVRIAALCLSLVTLSVHAQDTKIYQTDKYGNRQQQAYVVRGDKIYHTDKYGNRQQQAFVVQGDKIYQTDKYGNRQQQVFTIETRKPQNSKP